MITSSWLNSKANHKLPNPEAKPFSVIKSNRLSEIATFNNNNYVQGQTTEEENQLSYIESN